MFDFLITVLDKLFKILGIPNPSYNVDLAFAFVFLVIYLVAVPAMWLWGEMDSFGKLGSTAFMTIVLGICFLSARSKMR